MATIKEAMATAVAHHQAGRLVQAEEIYRDILVVRPTHADALHLLGLVALKTGRHEAALEHISRAIRIHGLEAIFHNSLGETYRALGKFGEGEASCRRAIELKPDYVEARYNLGLILATQRRHEEALPHFRRALQLQPAHAEAHHFLGLSLMFLRRPDEGMASFRQAVALKPDYARAHVDLGHALRGQRRFAEAADCYRRALELTPDDVGLHVNLGNVLKAQDLIDEAIASFRRALELKPDDAYGHNNLAVVLASRGRLDEAIFSYRRALHHKPDYAAAHSNLGNALAERHKMDEAIASYRRALELQPDFAGAHINLGNALRDCGHLDEAIACYGKALELKHDDPLALAHLGTTLKDQGRLDGAVANYRRALEVNPNDRGTYSSLLFTLNFCPGYDGRTLCEEHRAWDRRYAEHLGRSVEPHANDRAPHRRLRIGYVSPDFRTHCQAFFTVPLLSAHDHYHYEIFCYSDVVNGDRMTDRLRSYVDVWRDVAGLTDERLAQMVREDRIDVLVDLTMHMSATRLLMFARKPAPVQVTWLAYPGTTGVSAMNYRLTDPYLDPPGLFDGCYTEESVRLPDTFWCYDPLTTEPAVNALPATSAGHVTFGNLNNFCKINADVLQLWAKVLRAVEGSQLLLLTGEGGHRQRTLEVLREAGVAPERVLLRGRQQRAPYLGLYHQIDLGLDTFPYNGHTTSLDSFWMGVPVVTLVGQTVVGRAGLCQLRNLGLPELIAETPEDFVRISVELANDQPRLSALRASLRARMVASPLMDAPRFARNMEAAYRNMWQRWCGR